MRSTTETNNAGRLGSGYGRARTLVHFAHWQSALIMLSCVSLMWLSGRSRLGACVSNWHWSSEKRIDATGKQTMTPVRPYQRAVTIISLLVGLFGCDTPLDREEHRFVTGDVLVNQPYLTWCFGDGNVRREQYFFLPAAPTPLTGPPK